MLCLLISCASFILLSKSFTHHKPILQTWEDSLRLISLKFLGGFLSFLPKSRISLQPITSKFKKMVTFGSNVEVERETSLSLLDLPDLALDCILERLPPSGLCSMAAVCASLRESCTSDHLWGNHMNHKWGRLIGPAAYREWQLHGASRNRIRNYSVRTEKKGLMESLEASILHSSWITWQKLTPVCKVKASTSCLSVDSIMSLYLSLETGKFWFPAQVYNRENGNVGFMLSCYDARVRYDSTTNTFQARYSPYGRRATEENIPWDRLRAAPVDTPPHKLHVSDCLHDLKPGDYIEIQWRRNKEFPYGWWYGVIGHLEFCDGNENGCRCHCNDIVKLEFSQYTPGSRWREMTINRKDHREEGNEADGFYAGIRKIYNEEEIARWKRLWPTQVLG
ncbi:hypothetical protein ACFX13_009360 [Malus domestica]|uniref:F-box domain-containing protein n=1 Tax=Malus domestica TaxID=3750 RepID=A0A498IAZ3_MALDO|nr:F-box protein At2g26850-like [Malus domestica]XP_050113812.1 F-box protein At2g26850-like [Malus sylvestris]RXH80928.1 hypothetical protein DVH24_004842 [Malus domestica]